MNRTEFVNQVASILNDSIQLAEEEGGALLNVPAHSLIRHTIVNLYRGFMDDEVDVSFTISDIPAGESWNLFIYECIYDRVDTLFGIEIDDALYNMQHRKDPDCYDTTVEEVWK